jgi:GT2 family glycosyltransferase
MSILTRVGVVIIGRNEGERLSNCLKSILETANQLVYVDSGSTDDSVKVARDLGAEVVSLDMSIPFTAARARNEGFAHLKVIYPHIEFVQFVDGDCEVVSTWLSSAVKFLDEQIEVAAVCGRRRERFPNKTVYNKLCDMEWNTPVGEAKACGGDVLMRVIAFEKAQGYRNSLIAGEEPELCVRFRAAGWKIWRLNEEMTLHDAAMTRFSQWWKRTMRAGYAFAEGAYLHGAPPERHWVGEARRGLIWGLALPLITIVLFMINMKWALVFLLIYPAQIVRLALTAQTKNGAAWIPAFFLVLGKFPEMIGQLKFFQRRLSGKQGRLIEYK